MLKLKKSSTIPRIIAFPGKNAPSSIETCACEEQAGCVAWKRQQDKRDLQLVGYWSSAQNDPEKKCNTAQQKFLVVVLDNSMYSYYTESSKFTTHIDHQALPWILGMEKSTNSLEKLRLCLEDFKFKVQHLLGKGNTITDVLLLLSSDHVDECNLDAYISNCYVE